MPMKTMKERMAVIETKLDSVERIVDKNVADQEDNFEKVHERISNLNITMNKFINCADEKYAKKDRVDSLEQSINKLKITIAKYVGIILGAWGIITLGLSILGVI